MNKIEKQTKESRVALIVGASGDIGEAVAEKLASMNFRLYISANKNIERLKAFTQKKVEAESCQLDIRNSDQIENLCETIYETEGRLDILVNCAAANMEAPALGMTDEEWSTIIDTNLTGAFCLCRSAAKYMLLGRYGRIVNMSSISASTGGRGQINYAAAKAGIESMTRILALELGRKGILVNAVAPGCIETKMTEKIRQEYSEKILDNIALSRFGAPDEVADLICFLTSDSCTYITGQVIRIDGGYLL